MNENEQTPEQNTSEASKPAEKPHTIEDDFPLSDFPDTVLLIFKATFQGNPVQLEVFGNVNTARILKGNGIHEAVRTNGRFIEVDGHDVLWAEHVPPKDHQKRAIDQAKAALAAQQAETAKKAEEERIAKEKREMEAKALEETNRKRRGWFGKGWR